MAQNGYTPILLYSSSTASNSPAVGNLTNSTLGSELAINITDGKLFYKDNANAIQVIGWKVRPANAGGTGITSYAVGDLLYADTTSTLAKLADVATGNALISGGVNVAPFWGKIGLTTHVSGVLPTANGGTNLSSFTANGILYATSTSALTTGSALTFDGSLVVPQSAIGTSGTVGFRANDTTNSKNIQMFRAGSGYNYLGIVGTQGVIYSIDQLTIAMDTNGPLQLSLGGAVRWTYDSTGNVAVNTGAKGVNFSANSPAAGMTSQLLNWYEEGTWTPTVTATSGTITATNQGSRYTRIGKMVIAYGYLNIGSVSSPSGTMTIGGLPFTNGAQYAACSLTLFGGAFTQSVGGYVDANSNNIIATNLNANTAAAGGNIMVSASYMVA
jgi:hypothetical protein